MNPAIRKLRFDTVANITPVAAQKFPLPNWSLCGTELTLVTVAVILESLQHCTQVTAQRAANAMQTIDDALVKRLNKAVRASFPQEPDADALLAERFDTTSKPRSTGANMNSNLGNAYKAVASATHDDRTLEQRLNAVRQPILNAIIDSLSASPQSAADPVAAENAQKQQTPRSGSKLR